MVVTEKRETGDRGEELTAEFLMKQGLVILERNHWRKWGEIDIVAKNLKDSSYHFVEVKTVIRNLDNLEHEDDYSPADNMTYEKRKRLSRVIQTYLLENKLGECDWLVDVALVYIDKYSDRCKIEMIEDIEL